jgi:hypothetical protein
MTTFVTAVEVRQPNSGPITVWEMPVKVEKREDLTALVFHTDTELTTVTVLMTEADKHDLIRMLGGRRR